MLAEVQQEGRRSYLLVIGQLDIMTTCTIRDTNR